MEEKASNLEISTRTTTTTSQLPVQPILIKSQTLLEVSKIGKILRRVKIMVAKVHSLMVKCNSAVVQEVWINRNKKIVQGIWILMITEMMMMTMMILSNSHAPLLAY